MSAAILAGHLRRLFGNGRETLASSLFAKLVLGRLRLRGHDLTAQHVVWAYRLLLGREPESATVVLEKLRRWRTARELLLEIMTSEEFRLGHPDVGYLSEPNVVIKELDGGLRLFVDLCDYFVGAQIVKGVYEPDETAFVRRTVRSGQSVVDVGANVGYYSILMADLVGADGLVHSFEPVAWCADLLTRSIVENRFEDRVKLERRAVGDRGGLVRLGFQPGALNQGGAQLVTAAGAPRGHRVVEVPIVALDECDLRRPVGFVKVDAEGAERLVVRGAKRLLRDDRPIVLAELNRPQLALVSGCTPEDLAGEVESLGYTVHYLRGPDLTPGIPKVSGERVRSAVFLPRVGS
ncbi:MAG: FkbM family methyltransferase [Chloroflexi bacterium]|nr:FkbM family methyltransferase [Chloroflexota bacterium]